MTYFAASNVPQMSFLEPIQNLECMTGFFIDGIAVANQDKLQQLIKSKVGYKPAVKNSSHAMVLYTENIKNTEKIKQCLQSSPAEKYEVKQCTCGSYVQDVLNKAKELIQESILKKKHEIDFRTSVKASLFSMAVHRKKVNSFNSMLPLSDEFKLSEQKPKRFDNAVRANNSLHLEENLDESKNHQAISSNHSTHPY